MSRARRAGVSSSDAALDDAGAAATSAASVNGMALRVSERDFREQVRSLAKVYGWRMYFTQNSFRSPKGFPDVVLVRPPRLIFAEPKRQDGKTTPEQNEWLRDLLAVAAACDQYSDDRDGSLRVRLRQGPIEVAIWRPGDIQRIVKVLAR